MSLLLIFALFLSLPVTLGVYPLTTMNPGTLRFRVTTLRHANNRSLCLTYDGPQAKSSCHSIDGVYEPLVWTAYWDLRVSGEYTATADLIRDEGGRERHYTASQAFRVIGTF